MEHGCLKCHTGPRCNCDVPVAADGDTCDMCEKEEAIEDYKDSRHSTKKREKNVNFTNSGGRI